MLDGIDGRQRPSTPDSSHTFGVPNFTSVTPAGTPDRKGKRTRSSLAEQALANTLQSCSVESSPQEMQIRVLEQATALICARVIDAEEESEAGQASFLERTADDELMTPEQQHHAIDFESQLLRRHLQHLSLTFGIERTAGAEQNTQRLSKEDRQLANLARFLQTTLSRASLTIRRKRRRTMTCRGSSMFAPISRAMSLDDRRCAAKYRNARVSPDSSNPGLTPPGVSSQSSSLPPSDTETPIKAARHRSSGRRHSLSDVRLGGNITIYQTTPGHSGLDLLTDFGSRDVQIPQYARDLLDDLENFVDCIPLKVLTEPIGCHLPRPPSVVEDEFPLAEHEDDRYASDDDILFGALSEVSSISSLAPTAKWGHKTHIPSIFRFGGLRRTETQTLKATFPVVGRKTSFFGLLRRSREDGDKDSRWKGGRAIKKIVSGWFRR